MNNPEITNHPAAVTEALQGSETHKTGTEGLSRRGFLGVSSTALATAALGRLTVRDQEQQDTRTAEKDISASNPGQENKPLLDENPSSNMPPPTDHGDIGPVWYSFDLVHKRMQEGGWTHEVNSKVLPSSKDLTGVNLDYDTEFDGQAGSFGGRSISAWAGYAALGKALRSVTLSPRVFAKGNYASGTKNPGGHTWSTFDQLYPSNHDKFGFADQVGRRNLVQFRAGVEEEPTKKWKLKQAFEGYWLATANDNFYGSSGAIAVPAHPGASRHIGNEVDLLAEYQMNRGLNFGFGYARLFAGQFLKSNAAGKDYSYQRNQQN